MPSKSKSKDIFCQGNKFNKINKYHTSHHGRQADLWPSNSFSKKTRLSSTQTLALNCPTTKNLSGPILGSNQLGKNDPGSTLTFPR
jgi:hypothetical protein